jgi:CRISPR-associated protein Csx17
LHLDSLGLGLAALGLLILLNRKWPKIQGCWRDGCFVVIQGPTTISEILETVIRSESEGKLQKYGVVRGKKSKALWFDAQKLDSESNVTTSRNSAMWRAYQCEEDCLALHASHIAFNEGLAFNPLFGTGGNAGARIFAEGWFDAKFAIKKLSEKKATAELLRLGLEAFLTGLEVEHPKYPKRRKSQKSFGWNLGCWFGSANKTYNSGTAKPFREGMLTPWAMLLACEAFGLFQGSPSRRLGSALRAKGAFPFVTTEASPTAEGEAGKNLGELWLPVWEQPMSLPEVVALFQRGRAEVNGKGATTPPAFAAAILQRGVDAGIREFRRFLLLRTTSENTFESRLASVVPVAGKAEASTAIALTRMLGVRDSLPADRKKGKRWIYAGLRGPIDEALVAFAEKQSPETARAAVDAIVKSLRAADRNRGHRLSKKANPPRAPIRFQLLPGAWAESLLDEHGGDACAEARIGLALATLWASKHPNKTKKAGAAPLLPYWLGIKMTGPFCTMPEEPPFRRVWGAGTLTANLAAVLHRRLIEEEPSAEPPLGSWYHVGLGDIEAWLSGTLDDTEVEKWMMRFSLFEWNKDSVASLGKLLGHADQLGVVSGSLALFALFKPLFQSWLLSALLPAGSKREAAKTGPLPGIAAQLARGDVIAAAQLARNAYRAAGIEPAKLHFHNFACEDPQRLLAALLIPTQPRGITEDTFDGLNRPVPALCKRWLSPPNQTNNKL